jgi:hypothetical protein
VLGNLLNNAVKFTEEGGISVSATVEEGAEGKTQLRMSVSDSGVGFAPDLADRIFERFEQADISTSRKFGGLGLGLSIVKRLVELMKGKVSAQSKEGEGSTFEVIMSDLARPHRSLGRHHGGRSRGFRYRDAYREPSPAGRRRQSDEPPCGGIAAGAIGSADHVCGKRQGSRRESSRPAGSISC